MTDIKSAWNRAHEAKREDERQRALIQLHEHIDRLERRAAVAERVLKDAEDRLNTFIDEAFGPQPSVKGFFAKLDTLGILLSQSRADLRIALEERDRLRTTQQESP